MLAMDARRRGRPAEAVNADMIAARDREEAREMILAGDTTVRISDWLGMTCDQVNALRQVVAQEWLAAQKKATH